MRLRSASSFSPPESKRGRLGVEVGVGGEARGRESKRALRVEVLRGGRAAGKV